MDKKPLTYYFEFDQCGEWYNGELPKLLPFTLKTLSYYGIRHVALTDPLLALMMRYKGLSYRLKEELEKAGLDFVDAHSIYGTWWDLNEPDPARRAEMIAQHCHAMAIAASLGVKTITIHVGNSLSPTVKYPPSPWLDAMSKMTREQHIDNATEALKVLVPYAESLEMTICIENVRYICTTPEALLELKRRFPSDALGFCFDAGHSNLVTALYQSSDLPSQRAMAADTSTPLSIQILKQMLPHIVNCHLHDNDGMDDQHLNVGDGTLPWNDIIPLLKQAPRLLCLQSEVLPTHREIPLPTLVNTFQKFFGDWTE